MAMSREWIKALGSETRRAIEEHLKPINARIEDLERQLTLQQEKLEKAKLQIDQLRTRRS